MKFGNQKIQEMNKMLNEKLNEVLEWLDYGKSELYSGTENLPDYLKSLWS